MFLICLFKKVLCERFSVAKTLDSSTHEACVPWERILEGDRKREGEMFKNCVS